MGTTERVSIRRIDGHRIECIKDTLATERDVTIELGGEPLIRATCSPAQLREWTIGYLFSEGRISHREDIAAIHVGTTSLSVDLGTSAPATLVPLSPIDSDLAIDWRRLVAFAEEVAAGASIFRQTGGTHAMAIASEGGIVALTEDVSRSCALEKALGVALEAGTDFRGTFALLSSRVPSRIIAKLVRCGIPIASAVSAPTAEAVRLAERMRLCLCGFLRGERLNVYTHGWRIGL